MSWRRPCPRILSISAWSCSPASRGTPHVLEAEAARRANWGRPPPGRFLGLAFMEGYTSHLAQVAEISLAGGALKVHRITCVVDCGQMVNPRIVESQIESGIVFGLSATLWGDITLRAGRVRETNFNTYRVLRSNEMPELDVHLIPSEAAPGGIGELAVGPVAPAICNALFAATGPAASAACPWPCISSLKSGTADSGRE